MKNEISKTRQNELELIAENLVFRARDMKKTFRQTIDIVEWYSNDSEEDIYLLNAIDRAWHRQRQSLISK